jgi:hypothetical protein
MEVALLNPGANLATAFPDASRKCRDLKLESIWEEGVYAATWWRPMSSARIR